MNIKTILRPSAAVGMMASGLAAALMVGGLPRAADANPNGSTPAWSQRCDRQWNSAYCNPKIDDDDDDNNDRRVDKYGIYRAGGGGGLNPDDYRGKDRWNNRRLRGNNGRWKDGEPRNERDDWREERWDDRYDWNRGYRVRLAPGTVISTYPERRRRVVLRRSERYPLTLVVNRNVGRWDGRGGAVLPRGSRISGDLMPYRDGYRFVADEVRLPNGDRQSISAVSSPINTGDYWGRYDRDDDVYVSNGAYSIFDTILGRSSRNSPGVIGDIFGRYPNSRRDVIAIYPNESIDLRLTREFRLD